MNSSNKKIRDTIAKIHSISVHEKTNVSLPKIKKRYNEDSSIHRENERLRIKIENIKDSLTHRKQDKPKRYDDVL